MCFSTSGSPPPSSTGARHAFPYTSSLISSYTSDLSVSYSPVLWKARSRSCGTSALMCSNAVRSFCPSSESRLDQLIAAIRVERGKRLRSTIRRRTSGVGKWRRRRPSIAPPRRSPAGRCRVALRSPINSVSFRYLAICGQYLQARDQPLGPRNASSFARRWGCWATSVRARVAERPNLTRRSLCPRMVERGDQIAR